MPRAPPPPRHRPLPLPDATCRAAISAPSGFILAPPPGFRLAARVEVAMVAAREAEAIEAMEAMEAGVAEA